MGMLCPEVVQFVFNIQTQGEAGEQAIIPLFGGEVLSQRLQVQINDRAPLLFEPFSGSHHQRGLAHLPRGEHVAELALAQSLEQLRVCPALHVGKRHPGGRCRR